jgi:hypothetical protein
VHLLDFNKRILRRYKIVDWVVASILGVQSALNCIMNAILICYGCFPHVGLWVILHCSGFGGLVVSVLASSTQDRGFKPGWSRRIFQAKNSLECLPSEGK